MKLKEFWICQHDLKHSVIRAFIKKGYAKRSLAQSQDQHLINVREVSPEYDKAVEGLVEALELGITGKPESGLDKYVFGKMRDALEAYRKATK